MLVKQLSCYLSESSIQCSKEQQEQLLSFVSLLHKWNKIQSTLKTVDWKEDIKERKYTDVDTLAAAACAGGACEIDF